MGGWRASGAVWGAGEVAREVAADMMVESAALKAELAAGLARVLRQLQQGGGYEEQPPAMQPDYAQNY